MPTLPRTLGKGTFLLHDAGNLFPTLWLVHPSKHVGNFSGELSLPDTLGSGRLLTKIPPGEQWPVPLTLHLPSRSAWLRARAGCIHLLKLKLGDTGFPRVPELGPGH